MVTRERHFRIRNFDAGNNLEIFLVAAVASILIIRLYLELTNYPKLGGESLHIAHMLWGGLLMLVAIIILLSYLSKAWQLWAAIIGGIGFGTFIDEVGKFVTHDNDYFYKPAVALMYITFILIVLGIRAIHKKREYSQQEYIMNALREMEELVLHGLDEREKLRIQSYLKKCQTNEPLVSALKNLLNEIAVVPEKPQGFILRLKQSARSYYYKIVQFPIFPAAIITFFLVDLAIKLGYILVLIFFKGFGIQQIINIGIFYQLAQRLDHLTFVEWAEFASSLLSAVFVLLGAINIYRSRLTAYKMFERSILVSIFLTQVFMFYQQQFAALVGLTLNLLIWMALRYMIHKEALVMH
ncbi:MAG: hypothetical protein ONB13_08460 [candidate division KSB1 bacterium]|nr:hypothetical protein [candidate division KSB1 bacterium]MDZ7335018.1 hypothetical protein [candidate division KSB1 bacterium]MDZ7376639.1 hypothetical protein [candidate division KSB1 bacterium]MDZ7400173.1 hypothetical protein [candidate division KSB1 bacterium]